AGKVNRETAAEIGAQLDLAGYLPTRIDGETKVWAYNPLWYWVAAVTPRSRCPAGSTDAGTTESILEEQRDRARGQFESRGEPLPPPEELKHRSRLEPVRDFLAGQGDSIATIPNIVRLRSAFLQWQDDLRSQI